jgi:hypothetical protein
LLLLQTWCGAGVAGHMTGLSIIWYMYTCSYSLGVGPDEMKTCPGLNMICHELISPFCVRRDVICDPTAKYRTIDGSCNNLQNPLWGRSNRPHRRFLKAQYMDGMYWNCSK